MNFTKEITQMPINIKKSIQHHWLFVKGKKKKIAKIIQRDSSKNTHEWLTYKILPIPRIGEKVEATTHFLPSL